MVLTIAAECQHELCRVTQQLEMKKRTQAFQSSLEQPPKRKRKRKTGDAVLSVDCHRGLSYEGRDFSVKTLTLNLAISDYILSLLRVQIFSPIMRANSVLFY